MVQRCTQTKKSAQLCTLLGFAGVHSEFKGNRFISKKIGLIPIGLMLPSDRLDAQ
jgi:hypothetical protein